MQFLNFATFYRLHCLHTVHEMRPIVTDVVHNVVFVSVSLSDCLCLCVGYTGELCKKTAEPIKMPLGGADIRGSKKPCIRWGSRLDESSCSLQG